MNGAIICLAALLSLPVGAFSQARHKQSSDSLLLNLQHYQEFEDTAVLRMLDEAGNRVSHGDRQALSALFDLSFRSDGYVSAALGSTLGEVLLKHPHFFLKSLSVRTANERKHIAFMALLMDGGGMTEAEFQSLQRTFKTLASGKDSSLSRGSKSCLLALDLVRRQLKS